MSLDDSAGLVVMLIIWFNYNFCGSYICLEVASHGTFISNLQPKWSDLDVNQHVNNVKYIGWILEVD